MLLVLVILVMDQSIPVAPSLPPWGRGCPAVAREGGLGPAGIDCCITLSGNSGLCLNIREMTAFAENSWINIDRPVVSGLLHKYKFSGSKNPLKCTSVKDKQINQTAEWSFVMYRRENEEPTGASWLLSIKGWWTAHALLYWDSETVFLLRSFHSWALWLMMIIFTGKGYQFLRYAIFLSDAFIAIHMWCARRAGILFSLNRLNLYTWRIPVRVFAATTETQFWLLLFL